MSRWIGREETTASSTVLFPNSGSKVLVLLDFPRPVWPCHRDSGIGLGTFPAPWFAWVLSAGIAAVLSPLLDPFQDLPRPSLHPFVSFTASWSGLWGFPTALKYILTCSTFFVVCSGGCMNLMVSMGVSLVVPSMTRIASFCTLSRFSRFVCAIVVRPSP